jgi:hypothetical protein
MVKMKTDAVMIIPKRKIGNQNLAEAMANALQLSGCEELGIDEREIGTMIIPDAGNYNIFIYDNLSGGVGYVYDLAANRWNRWIEQAKDRLYVDKKHNEECENGCIKCIVTLNTNKPLPRREACEYLCGDNSNNTPEEPMITKESIIRPEISREDRFARFSK